MTGRHIPQSHAVSPRQWATLKGEEQLARDDEERHAYLMARCGLKPRTGPRPAPRPRRLTPWERAERTRAVLAEAAAGSTQPEIAARHGISVREVQRIVAGNPSGSRRGMVAIRLVVDDARVAKERAA